MPLMLSKLRTPFSRPARTTFPWLATLGFPAMAAALDRLPKEAKYLWVHGNTIRSLERRQKCICHICTRCYILHWSFGKCLQFSCIMSLPGQGLWSNFIRVELSPQVSNGVALGVCPVNHIDALVNSLNKTCSERIFTNFATDGFLLTLKIPTLD